MKKLIVFVFTVFSIQAFGQFDAPERVSQLRELLDTLRASRTEESRQLANTNFDNLIDQTLHEPTVFDIDFSQLSSVGVVDSPDGLVRIVTWNVEYEDDRQHYNGYVIHRSAIGKEPQVVKLNYFRDIYNPKPTEIVNEDQWYGALYYQIIPYNKGNKDSYLLLGWNGGGMNSNIKLIDVLSFTTNGVKFGQSIFKTKEQTYKRFYLEHSSKAVISLRYEPEYERIIFDHLSPESPSMTGFYEYYVPDMSYDAFTFQNAKLTLQEDVIAISKLSDKVQKATKIDPKTGEIEMETVDNEWINPTSENGIAPESHIAVLPEEANKADKERAKSDQKEEPKTDAMKEYEKKKHRRDKKGTNAVLQEPKKPKKKKS